MMLIGSIIFFIATIVIVVATVIIFMREVSSVKDYVDKQAASTKKEDTKLDKMVTETTTALSADVAVQTASMRNQLRTTASNLYNTIFTTADNIKAQFKAADSNILLATQSNITASESNILIRLNSNLTKVYNDAVAFTTSYITSSGSNLSTDYAAADKTVYSEAVAYTDTQYATLQRENAVLGQVTLSNAAEYTRSQINALKGDITTAYLESDRNTFNNAINQMTTQLTATASNLRRDYAAADTQMYDNIISFTSSNINATINPIDQRLTTSVDTLNRDLTTLTNKIGLYIQTDDNTRKTTVVADSMELTQSLSFASLYSLSINNTPTAPTSLQLKDSTGAQRFDINAQGANFSGSLTSTDKVCVNNECLTADDIIRIKQMLGGQQSTPTQATTTTTTTQPTTQDTTQPPADTTTQEAPLDATV